MRPHSQRRLGQQGNFGRNVLRLRSLASGYRDSAAVSSNREAKSPLPVRILQHLSTTRTSALPTTLGPTICSAIQHNPLPAASAPAARIAVSIRCTGLADRAPSSSPSSRLNNLQSYPPTTHRQPAHNRSDDCNRNWFVSQNALARPDLTRMCSTVSSVFESFAASSLFTSPRYVAHALYNSLRPSPIYMVGC
jgi:hypothetical protein